MSLDCNGGLFIHILVGVGRQAVEKGNFSTLYFVWSFLNAIVKWAGAARFQVSLQ